MPRTIALGKVEQVAMAVAYPLVFFHYLLYPLVVLFNRIAHAVLCLLGVDPVPDEDISRSEDELRMIVSASERGGKLDHMESRLIDNVYAGFHAQPADFPAVYHQYTNKSYPDAAP